MKPRPSNAAGHHQAIEAQAAAWLVEEESGFSPEHASAFAAWCRQDSRHQAAVDRLRDALCTLHRLRDYRPGAHIHPDPDLLAPAPRRRVLLPVYAAAAALALGALGVVAYRHADSLPGLPWGETARYVTDAGGFNRTPLPDGSVIELNADTEVRVRFTRGQRLVRLMRGEGHFVVAAEKHRPFVVETGGLQVRAIGTEFNVRTGANAVEVLVTHGRVKLAATRGAELLGAETPDLTAGQRAVVTNPQALEAGASSPVAIEAVSADEVRSALAWQNPRMHFVDATLAEVVRQFNQRSHIQITLADPSLGGIPVGGSFRPENVEAFVRLLTSANEVTAERPTPDRIVLRRVAKP
jgi:transmembrane sensor